MTETTLLISTPHGRAGLFARAADSLPVGWVLVQVRDLVGRRRAFYTLPRSRRAMLVAREPPRVLRGGLTALVSYYGLPANELQASEEHYEREVWTHAYDVKLRVTCQGLAPPGPVAS